ncbi:MAG: hypothetical protein JXK07_16730, partial [Spirochaetes bacterium]|nr:hypothetical protein [Spirochaetota bacterium]
LELQVDAVKNVNLFLSQPLAIQGEKMRAISAEKSISDGNMELQKLFDFIRKNTSEYKVL